MARGCRCRMAHGCRCRMARGCRCRMAHGWRCRTAQGCRCRMARGCRCGTAHRCRCRMARGCRCRTAHGCRCRTAHGCRCRTAQGCRCRTAQGCRCRICCRAPGTFQCQPLGRDSPGRADSWSGQVGSGAQFQSPGEQCLPVVLCQWSFASGPFHREVRLVDVWRAGAGEGGRADYIFMSCR